MKNTAIILCGGLGTRLKLYTNQLYPKILLSIGNQLFIDKLIEYWFKQNIETLYLVFSEDSHINMVSRYLNHFHKDKQIEILKYPDVDGTFNTLYDVLISNPQIKENLFISWSDIIPNTDLSISNKEYCIYTDSDKRHRYNFNGIIQPSQEQTGNIPGLYWIKSIDLKQFISYRIINRNNDFIEFLRAVDVELIDNIEITISDIGDVPKYEKYISENSITQRWFNDITFTNDKVIKCSIFKHGIDVMKSEIDFYETMTSLNVESIFPKIYKTVNTDDGTLIEMENLENSGFVTVNRYLTDAGLDKYEKCYADYLNAITQLHSSDTKNINIDDIIKEYITVTSERYKNIEYLIPKDIKNVLINNLNHDQYTIFDSKINRDYYRIMKDLSRYLLETYIESDYKFCPIHGDTNSSNTLYNSESKEIKFIDPRGKFGNSKIYGDPNYDIAKFLYGITGYDTFNLDKFYKNSLIKDQVKVLTIESANVPLLDRLTNDNHLKVLVGLIWLKLPYYIKNNPNKVIASFYTGLALLNRYLPRYE